MSFTPTWIRECVLPDYLLAAVRASGLDSGPQLHAMRSPAASDTFKGVGSWVSVVGHFDDPVSSTCRAASNPESISLESELPRASAVLDCRLVFVVTELRPVS
jgi:hypothetical protein